jgi:hypothetical protein
MVISDAATVRLKMVVTATDVPVISAVMGSVHGVHAIAGVPDNTPAELKVRPNPCKGVVGDQVIPRLGTEVACKAWE